MEAQESISIFSITGKITINIIKERKFWYLYIIKMLIDIPQICPLCGRNKINLYDNENIYNPVIARCTYNKFRKIIYLRQGTILDHYSKVPASVFFYVINLWIIYEKNGVQIHKFLSENLENYSISLKCIHEILETSRY